MSKFQSKSFYCKLKGEYALFTDPISKGGGEKYTYSIPTYQAIKGIVEQNYWKPSLIYYIDSIKVVNKIQTQSMGMRTLENKGTVSELHYNTYLKNVEYLVKFHFEWNESRKELKEDRNEFKHQAIILRSLDKGGRRDIFLGTRECVGYVERISDKEYEQSHSHYKNLNLNFGIMFHSFSYPSEGLNENDYKNLISNFTTIIMENGEIQFIRPEECEINNILGKYIVKSFTKENIKSVDEEYKEYEKYM